MKRNGILLTLLALLFMTLSLSQNLPGETNRVMHDTGCKIQDNRELCIEDRASEVFPHSEIQNLSSTEIGDTKLDKASFALKTRKLHMPFIANNGQMDVQVKFYAKTFGGTVFVAKDGKIVYALPNHKLYRTRLMT